MYLLSPRTAKVLQALGEGYRETGNKDLALKFFKECLRIYPDNPFANDMINKLEGA